MAWWQKARENTKRYTAFSAWVADVLPEEQQDLLYEYSGNANGARLADAPYS
jgi:hypothetical protein